MTECKKVEKTRIRNDSTVYWMTNSKVFHCAPVSPIDEQHQTSSADDGPVQGSVSAIAVHANLNVSISATDW